jgi:hypothetical protein
LRWQEAVAKQGDDLKMELNVEFDDDDARTYLCAKKCFEDKNDVTCDYDDEFIARLAEFYLDAKKGEGVVYETDEEANE